MAAFSEQTRWILARAVGQGGEAVGGKLPEAGYPRPALEDFKMRREPAPTEADLSDGEVLIEHHVLSVDPYVPAYMMKEPNVGKVIVAGAAGCVLASRSAQFSVGDFVVGNGGAAERSVMPGDKIRRISPDEGSAVPYDVAKVPLSASLGILGMPGATAFFALRDIIGSDLTGKMIVVTGAAGAVGSAAGQLAKIFGASMVVGFAGTDAKCDLGRMKYGFDRMVNYKTADIEAELQAACDAHAAQGGAEGTGAIFGFYDNTGGPVAKAVKAKMIDGGAVAKVGNIGGDDGYEDDGRLNIRGFYAGGIFDQWPESIKAMAGYIEAGSLKYDETVMNGIDNFPAAMMGMLAGKNEGKMIVVLKEGAALAGV